MTSSSHVNKGRTTDEAFRVAVLHAQEPLKHTEEKETAENSQQVSLKKEETVEAALLVAMDCEAITYIATCGQRILFIDQTSSWCPFVFWLILLSALPPMVCDGTAQFHSHLQKHAEILTK